MPGCPRLEMLHDATQIATSVDVIHHDIRGSGLRSAAWVSWISPGLLRSICVDVVGLRLKDVTVWVSRISPVLLRSIFVVCIDCQYCFVCGAVAVLSKYATNGYEM